MSVGEYGPMKPAVAIQDLRRKYSSIKEEIEDLMEGSVGDITMYYGTSDSRTQAPSTWSTSNPDPQYGEYIWQKVRISYVDPEKQYKETTPVCISGSSISIVSTVIKYWVGETGDPHPDPDSPEWEDNVPEVGPGQCLWTMTRVTYSDGTTTTSYSLSQSAGVNFTWIKYSHYADGRDPSTHLPAMTDTPQTGALKSIYLGAAYNKPTSTESDVPEDYEWSQYAGSDGYNNAEIFLYKRSDSIPSTWPPSSWPASFSYDFTTNILTDLTIPNSEGWYRDISELPTGYSNIYITSAVAHSSSLTDTISKTEFSDPIVLSENGYNSATVFLYKRAQSAPDKPTGAFTYTFSNGALTPIGSASLNGWAKEIPQNQQGNDHLCWVIQASAISQNTLDTIEAREWTNPIKFVQDGHPSSTTVTLYKRSDNVPTGTDAKPSGRLTYVYATGRITELDTDALNGWSQTIPTQGANDPGYVYVIYANSYNTEETDTINVADWSNPPILYTKDGINTSVITIYKRGTGGAPAGPTGTVEYTFSSSTLSEKTSGALNGWSASLSDATTSQNSNDPIWTMQAVAASSNDKDDILKTEWTGPVLIANSSYYTYVRYSASPDGSNPHSGVQPGDMYMGVYVGTSTTAPTDKTAYTWSRIGSSYTWIVYSDDSTHNPITTTPTANTTYIGIAYNKDSATPSTLASDYVWTKYVGDPSTSYWMNVSYSAINKNDNAEYTPSSLTLSGFYQTGGGNVTAYDANWKVTFYRSSGSEIVDTGSTGTTYTTRAIPANTTSVKCTMLLKGTATIIDEQTIPVVYDGVGYTAYLTNESHTFSGTYGQSISASVTTIAKLYKNTTEQNITDVTVDCSGLSGVSATVDRTTDPKNPVITITVSASDPSGVTNPGVIPITFTDGTESFTKNFSYSIATSGTSSTSYWLIADSLTTVKTIAYNSSHAIASVSYNPATITFSGKKQTGTGSIDNYAADFKVYLNGGSTPVAIRTNVVSFTYTIPVDVTNIVNTIKVTMSPVGSATIIDEQTVAALTAAQDGRGIYSITDYYQTNNDPQNPPTGTWSTSPVNPTSSEPYLWSYEIVTYTDGNEEPTDPRVIGNYAADGDPGRSIVSIVNHYLATNATTVDGTEPGWTTTVQTVSSNARYLWNYETITYSSAPLTEDTDFCIIGTYGQQGPAGTAGYNSATVFLYQRAVNASISKPSSTLTYTFSTGQLSGNLGSWSQEMPAADGNPCFVIQATALSRTDTYDIPATGSGSWGAVTKLVSDGEGSPGVSTVVINLYKKSSSAPTIDWQTTLRYTFADNTLSVIPSGWYRNIADIPSSTDPLYVTSATASSAAAYDDIAYNEWTTPTMLAQNGTNGSPGTPGMNTATVFLYQRDNSAPSKPSSNTTYTFSTGVLSGTLGNWTQTIPASDGNPCYVIQATAASTSTTATITSGNWSNAVVLVEDGTDGDPGTPGSNGYSTVVISLYKKSESAPSIDWTNTLTYTFATDTLSSLPTGWYRDIADIPSSTNPIYVTVATASSNTATDTIAPNEWTSPTVLAQNGTDGSPGTNGYNTATVFLYQRASSIPTKPSSALTYTFSTGTVTGTLGGWSTTMPASDGNPCYKIQATAASRDATYSIPATGSGSWSDIVKVVEDGTPGTPGTNGLNTAIVYLYKRANSSVTVDWSNTLTYTFSSGSLSAVPTGWSATIPGGSRYPLYVTAATASSRTDTDELDPDDFITPVVLVEDGADGKGYTVMLSNDSQTISADKSTALSTTAVTRTFTYRNTTTINNKVISVNNVSISGNVSNKSINITGITVTTTYNTGSNWPTLTFNISFATPSSVTYSIPIGIQVTDDGTTTTYTRYFGISIATNGEDGVGISEVKNVYYLNTTQTVPTKPPDGTEITSTSVLPTTWTTAVPTYITDHYYYTCVQTKYSDGSVKFTDVVEDSALTSANALADAGATAALNAIDQVIPLYYLSSSGNTPTIDTNTIIYTDTEPDHWTRMMPSIPASSSSIAQYKYFECTKLVTVGQSVAFSDIVEREMDNIILGWCDANDTTYIDGGRLYAESVSANLIRTGVIQSKASQPSFKIDLDNNTLEINSFSDIKSSENGTSLDQALNQLNTSITNIESYIKVGKIDSQGTLGVEIGASDNAFKSRFVANKISFYEGTSEVAYLSNAKLNVADARIAVLELASQTGFNDTNDSEWQIISDSNGFSIKWVGNL